MPEIPKKHEYASALLPALVAAGGTYALRRRIRGGLLGEQVARKIREKGLSRLQMGEHIGTSHPLLSKLEKYLQLGTSKAYRRASGEKPSRGAFHLAPSAQGQLDDKLIESLTWQRLSPKFMPTGMGVELPKAVGGRSSAKSVEAKIRALFSENLGGKDNFIFKSREGFQSGNSLLTDENLKQNIPIALKYLRTNGLRLGGKVRSFSEIEGMLANSPNSTIKQIRDLPGGVGAFDLARFLQGKRLDLVQERLPIVPGKEYRVHVANGKVIPGVSSPRGIDRTKWDKVKTVWQGLKDVAGLRSPELSKVEQHVQAHLDKLTPAQRLEHAKQLNLDVAQLQNGGYSVMETNPGHSGFLHNGYQATIPNHLLVSKLQGRDTHLLAGLRAALAGTGAGVAGAGVGAYRNRGQPKT